MVQEAFLAVWHHPGRGSVATWLLTITHHEAVDQVRRETRRRTPRVDLDQLHQVPNPGPGPHEQAWTAVRADQVRQTLADLPAEQRQVLLLAYYGGYTQTEIAALTGVPLGTVKTRTLAAMRKLGDALPGLSPHAGDDVRRTR